MKPSNILLTFCLSALLGTVPPPLRAIPTPSPKSAVYTASNHEIERLYHKLRQKKNLSLAQKLDWISAYFIGKPYQLGPLGEGSSGKFDQFPLYRTDAFDCLTYVETVIALVMSHNLAEFKHNLNKLRYKSGKVNFLQRNHFTSLDWNNNNQSMLIDVTSQITDKKQQPLYKTARAKIHKPNWYAHFNIQRIRLQPSNKQLAFERLNELKQKTRNFPVQTAEIHYLPLSRLFVHGQAKHYIFKQIPHASIVEIVRPNWNLSDKIGTCLNVSHLGFAIRKGDQLYFREASQRNQRVSDTLLSDYLKRYLHSQTVKGINIQKIEIKPDLAR